MTTIKDIWILQTTVDKMAERNNRRCRRLVALYRAGRKVEAHNWDYTDCMRISMESAQKDIEDAITQQAMAAIVS